MPRRWRRRGSTCATSDVRGKIHTSLPAVDVILSGARARSTRRGCDRSERGRLRTPGRWPSGDLLPLLFLGRFAMGIASLRGSRSAVDRPPRLSAT